MGEDRVRYRYWNEIRILAAFFSVSLLLVAGGVLLQIFGPRWATESLGAGPRSASIAVDIALIGIFPLVSATAGIVRRVVKGPTPPGRHSADTWATVEGRPD